MVLVETDVEKAEERAELAEAKANELEEELKVNFGRIDLKSLIETLKQVLIFV